MDEKTTENDEKTTEIAFRAHYKPWLCVAQEGSRPVLTGVLLDPARRCLVASDGHRLLQIPCEVAGDELDGEIIIPPDILERAWKWQKGTGYVKLQIRKRDGETIIEAKGKAGGVTQGTPIEGHYPRYTMLLPPATAALVESSAPVNPAYLAEIGEALGVMAISVYALKSDKGRVRAQYVLGQHWQQDRAGPASRREVAILMPLTGFVPPAKAAEIVRAYFSCHDKTE